MAIKKDSFANRIRTAIRALCPQSGDTCTTEAISIQANLTERKDNKRMLCALRDMTRAGELVRVSPVVYHPAATRQPSKPELRQVMWRVLRAERAVTVDDLQEMAGASREYADEWLATLARHGVVRREGSAYRIIKDSVEMPELTDNADKLRAIRAKKKQAALAALAGVSMAVAKAQAAVEAME